MAKSLSKTQASGRIALVLVRVATSVAALALLAGCGQASSPQPAAPPGSATAGPELARRPARPGEVVVRGDATPATRGPYAFGGRYLVRFEQYAPEAANLDFGGQTAFVAALQRRASDPRGERRLFRAAKRAGRREVTLRGRFYVDASFGDFPFVIRFTPLR
jgi:hypothetical protein